MKLRFFIGEQEVEPPHNSGEVRIQINHDEEDPDARFAASIPNFTFGVGGRATESGATIINQYREDGKTGGTGVWEGLPARAELESKGEVLNLIDGYIDLAGSGVEFECDLVTADMVDRGSSPWLNDRALFTYSFLASLSAGQPGRITPDDYIFAPYTNSKIPNTQDIAIFTLTGFVLAVQIKTVIQDLKEFVIEFFGVASLARAIAKIVFYVVYLIFLIIAMIKLIKDLFQSIIGPVKFQAGMRMRTLLDRGAEFLEMSFESTIFLDPFWDKVVVFPSKFESFDDGTGILGFKKPTPTIQTGYFEGTFLQILELAQNMWNARKIVEDNIIRMERIDVNVSEANYIIPEAEILQTRINADEIEALYQLRFSTDLSDENTIDEFEGTLTSIVTEPLAVDNADMVLMKGERQVNIGFALGKRKNKLTVPEKFANGVIKAICPLLNTLLRVAKPVLKKDKKNSKLPAGGICDLVSNRIGMMKLSADYFQVPKVVALDIKPNAVETKVSLDNAIKLNTDFLWENFHFVNSFVPSVKLPLPNQFVKFITPKPITFCFEDYKKVRRNNLIFDADGNVGKLVSLDWDPESEEAIIEYWIQEIYSRNLKETKDTPKGV